MNPTGRRRVHENVMLLLLRVAACQPAESAVREDAVKVLDTAETATGIDSLEARFIVAYNRDDPKNMAETYTEDVRFIQDGTVEEGRARMEEGWRAMRLP